MTLTLTLDRVIRHTFVYHSSTSIVEIEKNFFMNGRTDIESRPNKNVIM